MIGWWWFYSCDDVWYTTYMSCAVIMFVNTSLSTRSDINRLSLSSMLCESFIISIRLLINISLIIRDCFFVNFQHIGNNVLVFLCGYIFLSLLLYNRYLDDFKSSWYCDPQLSHILVYTHSWISCFFGVIFSCCHFSSILICVGLHSLVLWLVVERPRLNPHSLTDW